MPYLSPFRCPKVLFGPFRWQKSFSVFSRTRFFACLLAYCGPLKYCKSLQTTTNHPKPREKHSRVHFFILLYICCAFNDTFKPLIEPYQCRTQGGAKGAHAPPKRPQGIPCPQEKKKLIIDLMTPKASCKKVVPVRVAHSNPIPTRLQSVKMVAALVKYGNLLR